MSLNPILIIFLFLLFHNLPFVYSIGFWTTATLSESRYDLAATSINGELLLFGGGQNNNISTNRVDIYNTTSKEWSTATLSEARYGLQATSIKDLALFAGGTNYNNTCFDTVDIYNSSSREWTTGTLSKARCFLSAVSVGDYAIFAGGSCNGKTLNTTDIFNVSDQSWSTTELSEARNGLAGASVGEYALFAGGRDPNGHPTTLVDIYNINYLYIFCWTENLSEPQAYLTGTSVGELAMFAGGWNNTKGNRVNRVDIFNYSDSFSSSTGRYAWSTATLSVSRSDFSSSSFSDIAIFAGGWDGSTFYNTVDIYNSTSNSWSTATLSQSRAYLVAASGTDFAMFAGGMNTSGHNGTNIIDIYTISSTSATTSSTSSEASSSSPLVSNRIIIGIGIAVIALVIIGLAIFLFLFRRRSKRQQYKLNEEAIGNQSTLLSNNNSNVYKQIPARTSEIDTKDPYIISWSKLKVMKQIGEGAFGSVYLGEYNKTEVAIKQLTKKEVNEEDIEEFNKEAELMKSLPVHPNVVLFRGITLPPDPISIVTDFCEGGSLSDLLEKEKKIDISTKIRWIRNIAKGMLHLHRGIPGKEVIHRDLAARNILLKNGVAVITDFGMSRVKTTKEDSGKTQQSIGPWDGIRKSKSFRFSTSDIPISFYVF